MADVKKAEAGDKVVKLSDKVKFTVAYPKDYAGVKYMKEGKSYELHKLHAERLEKKGIGKVAK